MSETVRFASGGIVGGDGAILTAVPEMRPAVGGKMGTVYADECFISSDGLCRRSDPWHQAATLSSERTWICLTHPHGRES